MLPADPIAHHAAAKPGATAVAFLDDRYTWSALEDLVRRAAGFLDGTAPAGATIVTQGWNHPYFIALREAVFRTGRTFAAVSPAATDEEIGHVLKLTGAAMFLRAPDLHATAHRHADWSEAFAGPGRESPDRRAQAHNLLLTSGTTGLPKGCLRGVAADTTRMQSMVATFGLRPGQTHLVATPLYHSGPSIFQRTHLALGSPLRLTAKFDPAEVWRLAAAGEANTAFFVPTHYHRLLRHDPGLAVDAIETWWIAGAPASAALTEAVIRRIGEGKLWEFLGSSETGTVSVMRPEDHLRKRGSVGKPPPGVDVRILDDEGHELPAGETGLIYVKSGMLMAGYLGADAPQALRRDEYLSVGDLGRLDDEGFLYLSDRRTDLIISGGVNVYPAEVEAALLAYPGVHEAAVVGEPDEEWGARVIAVIGGGDVDVEKLQVFLAERLSPAKRPKRVEVWPALPHNAIGKPLRSEVRKTLLGRA